MRLIRPPVLRTLAVFAVLATLGVAQAQVRPEVGRPLQQAADLLKNNRAKEALAKVREAEAVPNRTPAENLTIDRMRGAAAARAGDPQTAIKSFEAVLASGRLSGAEQGQMTEQIAYQYAQLKDWPRTREWAAKARAMPGTNGAELDKLLAFVNAQSGDFAAVARDAQAAVEAAEKAGRRPDEADLLRLADALRRTGNTAGQTAVLEKLITHYPKRDYWQIVLGRVQAKPGFSQRLAVDVLRLKRQTKTLDSADEYVEMTQLLLQDGQAAEARAVVDEGFGAGLLGKGEQAERQQRLRALATQRATSAAADLASAEQGLADDKSGDTLVRIGMGYSGLGQHDKAVALIQQGIKKGGLRLPQQAQLHLGIALARAGQKDRAAQAFRAVGGTDGAAELARLWLRAP
ncbi:MAG: tetratricopeptide repeat protein [Betaproteobacteria bacterium]